MRIACIWPGTDGAIAVVRGDGSLIRVTDMPLEPAGWDKRTLIVSGKGLGAFLSREGPERTLLVFDRHQHSFLCGESLGLIRGVLIAQRRPWEFAAGDWHKAKLVLPWGGAGTDGAGAPLARECALTIWPGKTGLFPTELSSGRAKAALVAWLYVRRMHAKEAA